MAYRMSDKYWTPDDSASQFSLSQPQKDENANRIYTYFTRRGWTKKAICGMLGNMDVECRMNPRAHSTTADTYGLVQWHPASKLINWATTQNLDYQLGTTQCKRINYEENNELQWAAWAPYTFAEYARVLDDPVSVMARYFMIYYEVAGADTLAERQQWAEYYYGIVQMIYDFPLWLVPIISKKYKVLAQSKSQI